MHFVCVCVCMCVCVCVCVCVYIYTHTHTHTHTYIHTHTHTSEICMYIYFFLKYHTWCCTFWRRRQQAPPKRWYWTYVRSHTALEDWSWQSVPWHQFIVLCFACCIKQHFMQVHGEWIKAFGLLERFKVAGVPAKRFASRRIIESVPVAGGVRGVGGSWNAWNATANHIKLGFCVWWQDPAVIGILYIFIASVAFVWYRHRTVGSVSSQLTVVRVRVSSPTV